MLDLYDEFKAIITSLNERGIDYAVCGGLAMAVYGLARATIDIDLLIPAEQFAEVKAVVNPLGYTIEASLMTFAKGAVAIRRLSKLDPDSGDLLMLDLLLVTPQTEAAWETCMTFEWEGKSLRIVSREGLIALKSLRGNAQDLDDINRLREADES